MDLFDQAFADIVGVEGDFSPDPRDPGNWTGGRIGVGILKGTKFGISAAAYPELDIVNLMLDQARAIYRHDYWQRVHADDLPPAVAVLAFDCAVNQGQPTAIRLLQAAAGVAQDGVIGPLTMHALAAAHPGALFAELWAHRALRYAAGNSADQLGWFRRLATIAVEAIAANPLPVT